MYYPDQRYIASLMRIRREVRLPEEAIGNIIVTEGQAVEIRNKVARGNIPSRHVIIEAAKELGLRDHNALKNLLLVKERTKVAQKDPIAGKDPKRGRRIFAPFDGLIVYVGEGRIIFQEMPEIVELEAGVRGNVTRVVEGRMVEIETTGALLQGVWGNGKTVIATMRLEPPSGLDKLERESLDLNYKNEIIVTNRPLTKDSFDVMEIRTIAAVIAPSMDISLLPIALASEKGVLLTEGFGESRMNASAYDLLKEYDSYQATLNAYLSSRWDVRRPEVVVNRIGDANLPTPNAFESLRRGSKVKITREPYLGIMAKVLELVRVPQEIDNGLRVMVARVELNTTGAQVYVPLANIEFIGA
jgi:hypothetical protein